MKIASVSVVPYRTYRIGDEIKGVAIAEITQDSHFYEDHAEHYAFCKDVSGNLLVQIINAPMVFEYEQEVSA